MLSKSDKLYLDERFKQYVTHDYLDMRFRLFEQRLEEKFVTKEEFQRTMDRVFQNFDIIIGEIKAIREELAALSFRQQEHSAQIENHEVRLVTIESEKKIVH